MRWPPISVWLTWPTHEHGDAGNALIIVNAVVMPICVIAVALRLHARMNVKRHFGWDDAAIIIALVR